MISTTKPLPQIVAVCTSTKKGTKKKNIGKGFLMENQGFSGDAHSSPKTHRQVSLLAIESIDKMREMGLDVKPGDFAENITTHGIELTPLPLGTKLSAGQDAVLEVTQIGKKCHSPCEIGRKVGDCIMPREGIFCRVIKGGKVEIGDEISII
ncbi:MOSC domain-containing protein [Methanobacterium aggregans]|uniref:MOSC domain-containing protein n=1 Tax=Methanobacterium aggregans TaxID=1615586 RepID=UPI001AE1A509|nr:MOSC domain-containing protein [Methanobacterium aggregans]MBP2045311.1 MOSC domain-containing protein YiiM [Methanobacterium aggregans]